MIHQPRTVHSAHLITFFKPSRAASFGDPPKRRKRLKTRGERSRRAESGDRRSVSQPKSQDSGIVLEESSDQLETDHHRNKVNDEQVKFKPDRD